jgi:hypothetical protein
MTKVHAAKDDVRKMLGPINCARGQREGYTRICLDMG